MLIHIQLRKKKKKELYNTYIEIRGIPPTTNISNPTGTTTTTLNAVRSKARNVNRSRPYVQMIKWNGKDEQLITVNELINKIHKEQSTEKKTKVT